MRLSLGRSRCRGKEGFFSILGLSCIFPFVLAGCSFNSPPKIAVIPETEGEVSWDSVRYGAEAAAKNGAASIYWNAPSREDDVEAQIALVEDVANRRYQGLVLAPDHALALISPVRRLLSQGIPISIIGSSLPIPSSAGITNVINDDELGGRMAAQRVAMLLGGRGQIAVLGINPDFLGNMIRTRAFEGELARVAPAIGIVERRIGSFNVPHEQQVAQETLKTHPKLDLIVAMMWASSEGVIRTLNSTNEFRAVKLIAFDSTSVPPFDRSINLDAVIQEDIRTMGQKGTEAVIARLKRQAVPSLEIIRPILITRDNIDSREVHDLFPGLWETGDWLRRPIQ
jgi:ribose transport system substrate-binding protein